jgi:hypothetical protein
MFLLYAWIHRDAPNLIEENRDNENHSHKMQPMQFTNNHRLALADGNDIYPRNQRIFRLS